MRFSAQLNSRRNVLPGTCRYLEPTRKNRDTCVLLDSERTICTATSNEVAPSDLRFRKSKLANSAKLFLIPSLKTISTPSNHVTRQQKVRNTLLDRILVLAAATNQLATLHARLHQKRVQVLESLRRLVVFRDQNLGLGRLFW